MTGADRDVYQHRCILGEVTAPTLPLLVDPWRRHVHLPQCIHGRGSRLDPANTLWLPTSSQDGMVFASGAGFRTSHHRHREAVMESKMQVDKIRQLKFLPLYTSTGITLCLRTRSLLMPVESMCSVCLRITILYGTKNHHIIWHKKTHNNVHVKMVQAKLEFIVLSFNGKSRTRSVLA